MACAYLAMILLTLRGRLGGRTWYFLWPSLGSQCSTLVVAGQEGKGKAVEKPNIPEAKAMEVLLTLLGLPLFRRSNAHLEQALQLLDTTFHAAHTAILERKRWGSCCLLLVAVVCATCWDVACQGWRLPIPQVRSHPPLSDTLEPGLPKCENKPSELPQWQSALQDSACNHRVQTSNGGYLSRG